MQFSREASLLLGIGVKVQTGLPMALLWPTYRRKFSSKSSSKACDLFTCGSIENSQVATRLWDWNCNITDSTYNVPCFRSVSQEIMKRTQSILPINMEYEKKKQTKMIIQGFSRTICYLSVTSSYDFVVPTSASPAIALVGISQAKPSAQFSRNGCYIMLKISFIFKLLDNFHVVERLLDR